MQPNNKHIVSDGQTLLDVAIQRCGKLESIIELSILNDICITDDLYSQLELELPPVADRQMVEHYKRQGYCPATARTAVFTETGDPVESLGGIEYMGIEIDFIVS